MRQLCRQIARQQWAPELPWARPIRCSDYWCTMPGPDRYTRAGSSDYWCCSSGRNRCARCGRCGGLSCCGRGCGSCSASAFGLADTGVADVAKALLDACTACFSVSYALRAGAVPHFSAAAAARCVAPRLQIRARDEHTPRAIAQRRRRRCRHRALRQRLQHDQRGILTRWPWAEAPRGGADLPQSSGAPALCSRHALHSSGVHNLALRVHAANWAPPAPAEPDASRPAAVEHDVGVRARLRPEQHDLAELQRFLADRLAEQPLVGRAPVGPLQVLRARVADKLGQPSDHGMVGRQVRAHLALEGSKVHAHQALRDLHGGLDHAVR